MYMVNGENVLMWAYVNESTFGDHRNVGAFRITLIVLCTNEPETVEVSVACRLFGFSLFCPLSQCGMIGLLVWFLQLI